MVIEFEIDGKLIDLKPNTAITLQKNSNIFGAPDKIQTQRSFTMQGDFTANNTAALEHVELPSKNTDFLRTSKPCRLIADGLPIFVGKAVLLSIESDHYAIGLTFGDLTALAALVADSRKISQLGWDEIWLNWSPTSTYVTTGNYGLFNYKYSNVVVNNTNRMQISASINYAYLLNLVFAEYGIDCDVPTDFNDKYLTLTRNFNAPRYENPVLNIVNISGITSITRSDSNDIYPNIYRQANGYVVIQSKSGITKMVIEAEESGSPSDITYIFHKRSNGADVAQYPITINPTIIEIDSIYINDNDYFEVYNFDVGNIYTSVSFKPEFSNKIIAPKLTYTFQDQNYGQYMDFPLYANCDFTALDFIKQCQLLGGLFISQGAAANEFNLKSYDVLGARENAQVILPDCFQGLEKTELKLDPWARTNNFGYNKSDDEINSNYNAASFLLSNLQLKDVNGVASIFGTGANETPIRINQYDVSYKLQNLPIIYTQLVGGVLKAVPFVDILNDKYLTLIKSLNNLRVCELRLKLSNLQYKAFNINEMIYVEQIGKYFYPITVDYDLDRGILKLEAFVLGSLSEEVDIQEISLSQSALEVANSAAASAANTYALVINDYVPKTDIGVKIEEFRVKTTVTVAAADWSANTVTKTISGATNMANVWMYLPDARADKLLVGTNQITFDSHTGTTVTLSCGTTPTTTLVFNLEYQET